MLRLRIFELGKGCKDKSKLRKSSEKVKWLLVRRNTTTLACREDGRLVVYACSAVSMLFG